THVDLESLRRTRSAPWFALAGRGSIRISTDDRLHAWLHADRGADCGSDRCASVGDTTCPRTWSTRSAACGDLVRFVAGLEGQQPVVCRAAGPVAAVALGRAVSMANPAGCRSSCADTRWLKLSVCMDVDRQPGP